nr:MAG TPA: hypothetical protein [Caudoviricetes sp.]
MPKCLKSCEISQNTPNETDFVFCRFIRRNGKIIYPKNAKFFKFPRQSKGVKYG